jgi:hypothetical protein
MGHEDRLFFDGFFDDGLEKIVKVVDDYLNSLIKIKPDVNLEVELLEDGKIWRGYFLEPKEWGEKDIKYGYIDITQRYENSKIPVHVLIYCSGPKNKLWILGLIENLKNYLEISDGSPPPVKEPWLLIPDKGYDRKMVKLMHEGYDPDYIADKLGYATKTIYNRSSYLRVKKKFGKEIVPYFQEWKN